MARFTLPKRERLKNRKEYTRALKEGYSYKSSNLILRTLANNLAFNRLGVMLAKGIARTSVKRNYMRRIIKEAYRTTKPHRQAGFDVVAISLRPNPEYEELRKDMGYLLKKAGIL